MRREPVHRRQPDRRQAQFAGGLEEIEQEQEAQVVGLDIRRNWERR